MANFYTEVPELKYHLNNSMMERICDCLLYTSDAADEL